MSVQDQYLRYKRQNNLRTGIFKERVLLQQFLRDKLEEIWAEKPTFGHGGLFSNHMTGLAIGFAYYDCRPSTFCRNFCYGLPIAGVYDYYMLRLAVITSESLKTGDSRYLGPLYKELKLLRYMKIGHWGDAVPEQVPILGDLVRKNPRVMFWWYTRKKEVSIAANELGLSNLKAYLSLDPTTAYPSKSDYPYGITYLYGDGQTHNRHEEIVDDDRLVALFPLKRGSTVEPPEEYGLERHPRICREKELEAEARIRGEGTCLRCSGRCNYQPNAT